MKNNPSSKKIENFLNSSHSDLQSILLKCKKINEINSLFLSLLDTTLKPYCVVANTDRQRLILLVANGSIATQIRFQTPDLLRKFTTTPLLQRFKEIECKVRPFQTVNAIEAKKTKLTPLKPAIIEIIQQMAQTIEDSSLKEVMLRFGSTKLPPK